MIMDFLLVAMVIMVVRPMFSSMIVCMLVRFSLVPVGVAVLVNVLMRVGMLAVMGLGHLVTFMLVLMIVGVFVLVLMLVLMVSSNIASLFMV
jgi:hypothetical protein